MMKIEHLNEAVKLQKSLKVIDEQLAALDETKDLHINFFNRSIMIKQNDLKFGELRGSVRNILQNQRANIIRRCNQIDLLVEPTCIVK